MTRETGAGSFTQELCFRDFYQHVMVHWPRVSMGRNFILKYEAVQWDDDPDETKLKAWKEGKTGFPFIDAGMRQMAQQGWMHNRARMAVGSFLVKDLMLNWKEGERFFSKSLIDGDLGANNGGWQWIASCGKLKHIQRRATRELTASSQVPTPSLTSASLIQRVKARNSIQTATISELLFPSCAMSKVKPFMNHINISRSQNSKLLDIPNLL